MVNLNKCLQFDLSQPLSQTEGHLKIWIIYILISKDLQSFMKLRYQVICGGGPGR